MFCVRNQSFNSLGGSCFIIIIFAPAYFDICPCVLFVWIFHFSLDCKYVMWNKALIHVYYTQLTKLVIIIALLGNDLFCGNRHCSLICLFLFVYAF